MDEPIPVRIPLINPNEPEALVAELNVSEGQHVSAGDVLCTLETTKSTAEVTAETDGYVAGLQLAQGQPARAGDVLCYLAPMPGWQPAERPDPTDARGDENGSEEAELPAGLRITRPALALARRRGLDLGLLPIGPLITERAVQEQLDAGPAAPAAPDFSPPSGRWDPGSIFIYGAGGHGKMVADLLRVQGLYRVLGFVDDGLPSGSAVMGIPVLGGAAILESLHRQGVRLAVNAVGGVSNIGVRIEVFRRLASAGFTFPYLVHPRAVVEPGARIADGAHVLALAYVGSEAELGYGTIVGTGAIVSHDCKLGNFVNISPAAVLAGGVEVGSGSLIGMGATINLSVRIGAGARIGNGATVKANVPAGSIVRAGAVWPD